MRSCIVVAAVGLAACARSASTPPAASAPAPARPASPASAPGASASARPTSPASAQAPAAIEVSSGNACGALGDIPGPECCHQTQGVSMQPAFAAAARLGGDVRPFLFDNAVFATGGYIRVMKGEVESIGDGTKFGLMNLNGELAVPFEWDFIDWVCYEQIKMCKGCRRDCLGTDHCEHWRITGGTWSCLDINLRQVPCPSHLPSAKSAGPGRE